MRICDATIDTLISQREKMLSAYPVKKKTVATLCFATGGILMIVLL